MNSLQGNFELPEGSTNEVWEQVDDYYTNLFIEQDNVLEETIKTTHEAGLQPHNVTALQGKFLQMICKMIKAKRVLEIGTLGGYSTIWFGRALPVDGQLISLEANPVSVQVSRRNIERAGLENLVQIKQGKALDTITAIEGPFDVIFIDADKSNNPHYYEHAIRLSKPGTIIIADNVVRFGMVLNSSLDDPSVQGLRQFNEKVAKDPRVTATAIQTVGSKGYDGFALLIVN